MKNNQVYDYIVGLSDEKKLIFSRKIYSKLLREDFVFAKNINGLALGKDCELNDRFLFLYLCDEMKKGIDEVQYREYASYIFMMRNVSFILQPSEKAPHGLTLRPDFKQWQMDEQDGKYWFLKTWNLIPEWFHDWMQDIFAKLPEDVNIAFNKENNIDVA